MLRWVLAGLHMAGQDGARNHRPSTSAVPVPGEEGTRSPRKGLRAGQVGVEPSIITLFFFQRSAHAIGSQPFPSLLHGLS